MSRSNRWWFCGPPADVVADLFSKLGQFDPKKCYYTASISKEELEVRCRHQHRDIGRKREREGEREGEGESSQGV